MMLSVVVALIPTPVLCASLLKPVAKGHEAAETGFRLFRPFFLWFDRVESSGGAVSVAGGAHPASQGALPPPFVLIVAAMGYYFMRMPTSYLPDEDQGMMMAMVQLPPGPP